MSRPARIRVSIYTCVRMLYNLTGETSYLYIEFLCPPPPIPPSLPPSPSSLSTFFSPLLYGSLTWKGKNQLSPFPNSKANRSRIFGCCQSSRSLNRCTFFLYHCVEFASLGRHLQRTFKSMRQTWVHDLIRLHTRFACILKIGEQFECRVLQLFGYKYTLLRCSRVFVNFGVKFILNMWFYSAANLDNFPQVRNCHSRGYIIFYILNLMRIAEYMSCHQVLNPPNLNIYAFACPASARTTAYIYSCISWLYSMYINRDNYQNGMSLCNNMITQSFTGLHVEKN